MDYRSDIDGLRAIAVIPVILFHAGFSLFSGGFVGVDIFFVISGYLITTIILKEMDENTFSLVNFYQRRARRILPVLFFVVIICTPFAYLWLMPHHLEDFFQSIIAVATFTSNILFWRESGYFGEESELKPLLHTWSLAVEEQFYILFPLLLMTIKRFNKHWKLAILAVGFIGSLVLAQWAAYHKADAAFYLLPTRAWELLIGVFVAFYLASHSVKKLSIHTYQVLSIAGLLMIVYSIVYFNQTTPFPSFYALVPTIGTALILLFSVPGTLVNRLLSIRVFVGIGLISYSAYLWHQPIFAFAKYRTLTAPEASIMLALCLLVLPIAYISWRFIETPFRKGLNIKPKTALVTSTVLCCLFAAFGTVGTFHKKEGLVIEREELAGKYQYMRENSDYTVAIWGDSFADAFAQSLGRALNKKNISMVGFILHSCPSILNVTRNENKRLGSDASDKCKAFNKNSLEEILKINPKYIVISNAYGGYLRGKNIDGEPILLSDTEKSLDPKEYIPLHTYQLANLFYEKGITPIIIAAHPKLDNFRAILRTDHFKENLISANIEEAIVNSKTFKNALKPIIDNILYFDTTDIFCEKNKTTCSPFKESGKESYLYYDGSHLSTYGAKLLTNKIITTLSQKK